MPQILILGGTNGVVLRQEIQRDLLAAGAKAAGIASAYVTVSGVEDIKDVLVRAGVKEYRLIAGIDDEITHPAALDLARSWGWRVRIGRAAVGRFHPKLVIAGAGFDKSGDLRHPRFLYVGSGNITRAGLAQNTEAALIAHADDVVSKTDVLFGPLWRLADPLTPSNLKAYEARFAERSRQRKPDVLASLGVSEDQDVAHIDRTRLRAAQPPRRSAVDNAFAAAAWAGLQSYTGGFAFQVEFPRLAGQVVNRLAGGMKGNRVDVYCEDGQIHSMTYRFYDDNAMFRLNVPNGVPVVAWARENHDGIALVERGPEGGAPLRLRILMPGQEATEAMARSYALGTWGRTPTRLYGWY